MDERNRQMSSLPVSNRVDVVYRIGCDCVQYKEVLKCKKNTIIVQLD